MTKIGGVVRAFGRSKSGNVAMLFGLAAIPLMVGVGAAVDYGRALLVRERMGNAADAAALAVGSWQGQTKAQLQVKARQYFDANFPPEILGAPASLNLNFSGNDVVVDVSGTVPTTMLRLANFQSIDVHASSTVTIGMGTLEVALALDNSGSMAGSKLTALKTAATNLVDSLFDSANGSTKADPIKIAVVPFAAGVNVGPQYANASWMDSNANNPYHGDAQEANGSPVVNNFTLFKSLKSSNDSAVAWAGCIEARPSPYDVNDAEPSSGTPPTLFVPMFAPDEPDNWTCNESNCRNSGSGSKRRVNGAPNGSVPHNNYLPDAGTAITCGSASNTDSNWTCFDGSANCGPGKNSGRKEEDGFAGLNISADKNCKYGTSSNKATVATVTVRGWTAGPNFLCTSAPLLPLSTEKTTIKQRISAMQAQGLTGVGEGAMWGWRALSPGEPFTQGRGYNTEENQKVLILMTDGVNTYTPNDKFLKSSYSIYGYVSQGHLGTTSTSSSTLTAKMNERTLAACNNIKAAGITVYTVAFAMANESAGLGLLQSCASAEDKYFAPNSESELISAFKAIGKDISELRITK